MAETKRKRGRPKGMKNGEGKKVKKKNKEKRSAKAC